MPEYKDGSSMSGGGGPTTPGVTLDQEIVRFDGTTGTILEGTGTRDYGKSATDPTSPTPSDGDRYWNTTTKQTMAYDGGLARWRPISQDIVTPTITTPASGATGVSPKPTFVGSAFLSDFAGVTIASIQLQISTASSFGSFTVNKTVSDASSLSSLSITFGLGDTTGTVKDGFLNDATLYYCRVRYQDSSGNWSLYSPDAYSLTTGTFPTRFASVPSVSGNWNDGATWGNTSPGADGLDYPPTWGGTEVYINQNSVVTVPASYTATVKSLWVGIVNLNPSNSGLVVDTDATLNMETGTTEYIPAGNLTVASLSSDIAIGVSAFSLSGAYSVADVIVLDSDDLRYMESVKVKTVSGSGPYDYTIETSGVKPSGGTWGVTIYPHTAASTKVRVADGQPSPYITYGFFAAGMATTITSNPGSSWNFNGLVSYLPDWGGANAVDWKFLGDPNNRITLTGHAGAVPDYSVLQFCEEIDVGGGWFPHEWAIEYTDFVRFSQMSLFGTQGGDKHLWRSSFSQCGYVKLFGSASASRRGYVSNRFIDGHSHNNEIMRDGGYNATLTNDNYAYRAYANNVFTILDQAYGELINCNYGSNYLVDNILVGCGTSVTNGAPSRGRRNIYFGALPMNTFYTEEGYGAAVGYDGIHEDNLKFTYGGNPWVYKWAGTSAGSSIYIRDNYLEEGSIAINDGGDWFPGDNSVFNYRQGNLIVFTRHDNPIIITGASFANHLILNETFHSPPESMFGGSMYSMQFNGTYYSVAATGDGNVQRDCLVSDVSALSPTTVDTSIRLHPGDDQLDDVRNNHYWGIDGGDTHPYLGSSEQPYINLTSSLDASTIKAANPVSITDTTFIADDTNGALWNGAGLNYPFFVVFNRGGGVLEELVEVASYALVGSDHTITLKAATQFAKAHAAGVSIDYAYGYGDTAGDPFYSGVTSDGVSRRDMAEFYVALKANDGISVTNVTSLTDPPDASKLAIWEAFNVEFTKYLTSDWDVRFDRKNIKDWISQGYIPQAPALWTGSTDGTYQGAIDPGTIGWSNTHSIVMDGAGDTIVVADHADLDATSVSLLMFFKADAGTPTGSLYQKVGAYGVTMSLGKPQAKVTVGATEYTVTAADSVCDGKWHHLGMTYDQTTLILWVDGRAVAEAAQTGAVATTATTLDLGQLGTPGVACNLGQVSMFDAGLTKDQYLNYARPVESTHKALYRFNGNSNDSTTNAYNGVDSGAITYTPGVKGDSKATFDGVSDYITLPTGVRFEGETLHTMVWTICGWFTPAAITEQSVLDLGGEVGLKIDATGKWRGWYNNTTPTEKYCVSNDVVVAAQTYHVAFVCSGYEATLYVDGVEQDSRIMSQFDTINTTSSVCRVGSPYAATSTRYNGSMELLEIHSDYITPWEIKRKSLNKIIPTDMSDHAQYAGNCKNFFMFSDNPRAASGGNNVGDKSGVYPGTARPGVLTNMSTTPGEAQSTDAPGWFDNT